jgi:hypothetical protein
MTQIEVRQFGDLSQHELRLLEREGNIRHKDLTEYEKSKAMIEYFQTVKEELREEARPDFLADSAKKLVDVHIKTIHNKRSLNGQVISSEQLVQLKPTSREFRAGC